MYQIWICLCIDLYLNHLFQAWLNQEGYGEIEAVAQMCSAEKVFLTISQNLQENTCARVSILIKLQAWGLQLY